MFFHFFFGEHKFRVELHGNLRPGTSLITTEWVTISENSGWSSLSWMESLSRMEILWFVCWNRDIEYRIGCWLSKENDVSSVPTILCSVDIDEVGPGCFSFANDGTSWFGFSPCHHGSRRQALSRHVCG